MTTVQIIVTPKRSVLDPQGEAVKKALQSLGLEKVDGVRVGKFIELELKNSVNPQLTEKLTTICHDLLSNPVIEDYQLILPEVPSRADYEGLKDPYLESEEDLVALESKPKKAAKKLAKAKKSAKAKKNKEVVTPPAPTKGKKSDQAKPAPAQKEIKDLSEARPKAKTKSSGAGK